MKKLLLLIISVFCFLFSFPQNAKAFFFNNAYRIVEDPAGVYVIEINTKKVKNKFRPVVVSELEENQSVYKRLKAKLVVNAGFFDPKNQKTVSYVTIDENLIADPLQNENLMENEALKPYMEKILNRSEFRILTNKKGKIIYDIAQHNEPAPENFIIKHAIQAGPMLLPDLKLDEEFFVLVRNGKIVSESASALHKFARTAIGIRENNVYLFIITNDNPMKLEEVANLAKEWGMEKAMAFDGGGSTSFDSKKLHIISEKDNQARKLKSFLVLFK